MVMANEAGEAASVAANAASLADSLDMDRWRFPKQTRSLQRPHLPALYSEQYFHTAENLNLRFSEQHTPNPKTITPKIA